jgi:hypothetical protein
VNRVAVSHSRNIIVGSYVPERPNTEPEENDKLTILIPETKHKSDGNRLFHML